MKKSESVTLKDIAERAGVSMMAVSMALRGRPGVSDETREKIKALAVEMGYRKDPLLSSLSARRKGGARHFNRLAYVGAWETDDFMGIGYNRQFFRGATEAGKELGYDLEPYWLNPELSLERHSTILHNRGFDGLLIAPVDDEMKKLNLDWKRFSAVALGRSLESPALHFASANHFGGMIRVCRELYELGYRRIGLAMRESTSVRTQGRWSGAMLEFNRSIPVELQLTPLIADPLSQEAFGTWVQREKPDVVLSLGDRPIQWLSEIGFRIPEDMGYVMLERMEDVPGQPKFSALDQNLPEVGRAALKLLHADIAAGNRGVPAIRSSLLIDGSWVRGERVRASVK
ncbi:MAG: LacI family DNA-binding transcriptional regulator [Verrucomicrobia bacterium]|nr:LacI family DNA-binding transcriptional regulator [Verrucomicrobiota bacterium]MCH8513664.1 LacI family transcriptional regulator [Kiritimatiellia bacterium]